MILRESTRFMAVKLTGMGLGFLLHLLLARVCGVQDYGLYTLTITWVLLLALLAKCGFDTLLVRHIARSASAGAWAEAKTGLRASNQGVAILSLIIATAVIGLLNWGGPAIRGWLPSTLVLAVVLIPIEVLVALRRATLRGLKQSALAQVPEQVVRPLLFMALISLAYAGGLTMSAGPALLAHGLATLAAVLAGSWLLQRYSPALSQAKSGSARPLAWMRMGVPFLFLSSMQYLSSHVDILMLGGMLEHEDVGVYAIASRISVFVGFGLLATNSILAPIIAEAHSRNDHHGLELALRKALLFSSGLGLLAAIILIMTGKIVLKFFGADFVAGHMALTILIGSQLINILFGPVGYLLAMTGHERIAGISLLFSAILNVALNLALIPRYGINGAAAATLFSILAWNMTLFLVVRQRLGINPTVIRRW